MQKWLVIRDWTEWMKGICHTWSRGRHFSPSLPGDRYLNLGSPKKRPPGRNLGEHRLVRSSGATSRGTALILLSLCKCVLTHFRYFSNSYHFSNIRRLFELPWFPHKANVRYLWNLHTIDKTSSSEMSLLCFWHLENQSFLTTLSYYGFCKWPAIPAFFQNPFVPRVLGLFLFPRFFVEKFRIVLEFLSTRKT